MAEEGTTIAGASGRPPRLTHEELRRAQAETLEAPRRRYGIAARILFTLLDVVYGKPLTLSKFKVLELIARVPYMAWEQVAFIAITHVHTRTGMADAYTSVLPRPARSKTTRCTTCSSSKS